MKLSKKSGGIAVAVVMAGGITAASAGSAFASPAGSPHTPVAKSAEKDAAHKAKHKGAHGHHGRFLTGTHGEKTVKGKDGKTVTHEWQVGKVTAASATSLTVKSSDGVSWTWTTSATTKVHSPKHAAPKVGDEVLVEGVKSGTVNTARAVIDPGQAAIAKWTQHQAHEQDKDKGADKGKQAGSDADKNAPKGKHRKAGGVGHGPAQPAGAPGHDA